MPALFLCSTVPSGSPSALNATSKTSTSITISFSAVHQRLLNGPLTGYTVAVRLEDGSVTRMIRTNETVITVGSLQKATRYSVSVKACNRVSCGPNSTAIFVSTMEDGTMIFDEFYLGFSADEREHAVS